MSIRKYNKFDWDNYHRKTASKFLEKLNLSVLSAHNKIQKLPKMQNLVQEIEVIAKPKPIITNTDNKINKKVKNISQISWSSIKFSEEDESEHIEHDNLKLNGLYIFIIDIVQSDEKQQTIDEIISEHKSSPNRESELMYTKFLDFSWIHERKTRKQRFAEMSFDTEVHNIYSPKYSTESSESEQSEEE